MNFVTVRGLQGQNDTKGYQVRAEMVATLTAWEDMQFTKNGTKFQQLTITDNAGEANKVKIFAGKGNGVLQTAVNTQLAFSVGPNPYQNVMYYSGFCNSDVQVVQQPTQNAPQPAPQPAAQPAPQPAAHVVWQDPVRDDIRFAQALNLAVSELVHGVIDTSLVESKAGVYYTILKTRNFPATHSNRGFQDTNNVPPVTVEDAAKGMLPEEDLPF